MTTKTCPVSVLKPQQISRMYEIMAAYYNNVSRIQFEKDLGQKNEVILLIDDSGQIQGFSTILLKKMKMSSGQKALAIYSGDTVLDRQFWGNGALGIAFSNYLLRVRLQNLLTPVYWFLITKGYKTYLLMANNFFQHYPRFEKATPSDMQSLMNQFYGEMFGKLYDPKSCLIHPEGPSCALKVSVADIDPQLLEIPRIKFFAEQNPDWQNGVELTCIARVSIWVPARYFMKKIVRSVPKLIGGLGEHKQKSPHPRSHG